MRVDELTDGEDIAGRIVNRREDLRPECRLRHSSYSFVGAIHESPSRRTHSPPGIAFAPQQRRFILLRGTRAPTEISTVPVAVYQQETSTYVIPRAQFPPLAVTPRATARIPPAR